MKQQKEAYRTTIQVKPYVVKQIKPRLERSGWSISVLTERLLNLWLSGSVDDLLRPQHD